MAFRTRKNVGRDLIFFSWEIDWMVVVCYWSNSCELQVVLHSHHVHVSSEKKSRCKLFWSKIMRADEFKIHQMICTDTLLYDNHCNIP